jgi:hypothetical protein
MYRGPTTAAMDILKGCGLPGLTLCSGSLVVLGWSLLTCQQFVCNPGTNAADSYLKGALDSKSAVSCSAVNNRTPELMRGIWYALTPCARDCRLQSVWCRFVVSTILLIFLPNKSLRASGFIGSS